MTHVCYVTTALLIEKSQYWGDVIVETYFELEIRRHSVAMRDCTKFLVLNKDFWTLPADKDTRVLDVAIIIELCERSSTLIHFTTRVPQKRYTR